jgi:hypothetical protein
MSSEGDQTPQPAPTPPSARRLAEAVKPPSRKRKATLAAPPVPAPLTPAGEVVPEHLQAAHDTHQFKLGLVGGQGISGKDEAAIKAWTDRKAVELLPTVIADLAFDLKYGTDKQRAEARDRVLDMHGLRKREAAAGQHATIVLNLGDGGKSLTAKLPWLSRSDVASEDEGGE